MNGQKAPITLENQVSLIIPTYNYGRFLPRCLEGALGQTRPPLEIIVVDDGSQDDTRRVVEPYLDRVTYVHQENQGLSGARNTGAARSRAEWLLFCDADDRLVPQALEWLAAAIPATGAGVVYGRCREVFPDGGVGRIVGSCAAAGEPPHPARASFWKSVISTTGAALIHRRAFTEVGGYRMPWRLVEDREFWVKVGLLFPFACTEQVVLEKLCHPGSLVSREADNIFAALLIQLDLLDWCGERGLDAEALLAGPAAVLANALEFLVGGGHWRHAARVLQLSRKYRVPAGVLGAAAFRRGLPAWFRRFQARLLKRVRA